MPDVDPESEYELVMPFVVVTSKGGPYDDEAFTAGWACAGLDHDLATAASIGADSLVRSVRPDAMPQVDLIAMKHGYAFAAEPFEDAPGDWHVVTFTREVAP